MLGIDRCVRPMLDGFPVAWFAPNYKYLAQAWRDFVRLLKPIIRYKNRSEWRIELITGGSIEFWTLLDPDSGRSRKYKRVVVDEAAKSANLEMCWTQAIYATLTDYSGDAWFLSTPKGRNYFWTLFCFGLDPEKPEWATFSTSALTGLPTSTNPYMPPGEVDAARVQLPERVFQQEYLATFLEESAGVFRNVTQSIDKGRCDPDAPRKNTQYSTGGDLARKEDFSVFSTLDPACRQCHFDRFNQISWERQIATATDILRRYPGDLVLDCTGVGDPIYERFVDAGLYVVPFQFTNASKTRLIDNLAMGLERGRLRLMDIPQQTNELLAFEYEMTPGRLVKMGAPLGMHDDCVIGLALAYWGISNTPWIQVL